LAGVETQGQGQRGGEREGDGGAAHASGPLWN
jgi:hypothetical protein